MYKKDSYDGRSGPSYVAYKLLTTEPTLIMITPISGEFVGERFRHFFLELKQNLCGHRFKDDREV